MIRSSIAALLSNRAPQPGQARLFTRPGIDADKRWIGKKAELLGRRPDRARAGRDDARTLLLRSALRACEAGRAIAAAIEAMRSARRNGKVRHILGRVNWLRWAFWIAALFALVMATLPKPPELPGARSDKIQHIIAFVVLAGLAAAAYRRAPLIVIATGLSAFGALIEVLQAIPALHRDSDIQDWLADTMASAFVLLILWLWRMRPKKRLSPEPENPVRGSGKRRRP